MTNRALKVKGYRVLVKPDPIEETINGFIMVNDKKLERAGQIIGTVIEVGALCWTNHIDPAPWCEVGDLVLYSRYAGKFVNDPNTNEEFVILNDEDIICTVHREESI